MAMSICFWARSNNSWRLCLKRNLSKCIADGERLCSPRLVDIAVRQVFSARLATWYRFSKCYMNVVPKTFNASVVCVAWGIYVQIIIIMISSNWCIIANACLYRFAIIFISIVCDANKLARGNRSYFSMLSIINQVHELNQIMLVIFWTVEFYRLFLVH